MCREYAYMTAFFLFPYFLYTLKHTFYKLPWAFFNLLQSSKHQKNKICLYFQVLHMLFVFFFGLPGLSISRIVLKSPQGQ